MQKSLRLKERSQQTIEENTSAPKAKACEPHCLTDKPITGDKLAQNFTKLGGDIIALKQALCVHNKLKGKKLKGPIPSLNDNGFLVIQDLNQSSKKRRLYLINLHTGNVKAYFSNHGMGKLNFANDEDRNKWLQMKEFAPAFSNERGSNLTPRGFHISGQRISKPERNWKWHMELHGLQQNINHNSLARGIIFHAGYRQTENVISVPSTFVDSDKDQTQGPLMTNVQSENYYLNYGCTSVAPEYAEEIYQKTKNGTLFYNYTPHEKNLGPSYCAPDISNKIK